MVKAFYNTDERAVLMIESYDDIIAEIDNSTSLYYDSSSRELKWEKSRQESLWSESVREGKAVLPKDMDIVFNDRFTTKHSNVYGILESSDEYNIDGITLFDRDGDGKADLMKVSVYRTGVVSAVDAARMIIKGKDSESIIDYKKEQPEPELKITDKNGNSVKLADIKKNSVLSIFSRIDSARGETETIRIIVSTDAVSGNVSDKRRTADGYAVGITGTQYMLAKGAEKLADSIKIGKNYTVYTDHNGRIAGFKMKGGTGTNIGAVIGRAPQKARRFSCI